MNRYEYICDPAEIYRRSFSIISEESGLDRFPKDIRPVAMRLVHACGMVDVVEDLAFSDGAVEAGIAALKRGNAVFTDVEMVKSGIIERLLPTENKVVCTLNDARVPDLSAKLGTTRSAVAVDLWDGRVNGAVVAIGNAPTALFRLLERIEAGQVRPALVIGVPVGFVGAVESKKALAESPFGVEYLTIHGRRGGSAMASSVVNALAGTCK